MKDIKKRQKGFLAVFLAVVIGLLPTVNVWAATTYTIGLRDKKTGEEKYQWYVNNGNGEEIAHDKGDADVSGSGGVIIYVVQGDTINISTENSVGFPENENINSITSSKKADDTAYTGNQWDDNSLTINSEADGISAWKLRVSGNTSGTDTIGGTIHTIRFNEADTYTLRYYKADGTTAYTGNDLKGNKTTMPKIEGVGSSYERDLIDLDDTETSVFKGWYTTAVDTDEVVGKKVEKLRSAFINSSSVLQGKENDGQTGYTDLAAVVDDDNVFYDLYARWGYRVTFDPNGGTLGAGTVNPVVDKIDGGVLIAAPANDPVKAYNEFTGWYKADGTKWDFTSDKVEGNTTLYAHWKDKSGYFPGPGPAPGPSGDDDDDSDHSEDESHDNYVITYLPDNDLNEKVITSTEKTQIDLPKVLFTPRPGQMLEGWKLADTTKTPPVATGSLIKPGTTYDLDTDVAFMAIWKDNPTFKIECDDNYDLMPPENTPESLEQMIRESLKITYYEDGEEPKEGDTEKQRKTYVLGTAIPAEELEVVIEDPKTIRKVGTFQAKIIYKGLYKRTLEKTVSVTVLDPNGNTFGTLEINDINALSPVTITYPDSIPCHGSKWTKIKSLVKVECEKAKIKLNNVENSELGKLNAGEKGKITELTVKVPAKDNNLKDKKADKLTKKLNKHIKQELPLYITIKPLIVMPEMFAEANVKDGKLKSISILLPDKTKVTIKPDNFTVDDVNQVVTFTGNYGGNLTFEELGMSPTPAK